MTSPFADHTWPGDALSGADGTADTLAAAPTPVVFADAATVLEALPATSLAKIPVPRLPSVEEIVAQVESTRPTHDAEEPHGQWWGPSAGIAPRPVPMSMPSVVPATDPRSWAPPSLPSRPRPALPQAPVRSARPAGAIRPARPAPAARKKSGSGWSVLFVIIFFLVISGVGREMLDVLAGFFGR